MLAAGVPPVKVQDQLVGVLVERSLKLMLCPSVIVVALAVKSATGAGGNAGFTVI